MQGARRTRMLAEARLFAATALYLYVCLSALVLLKSAVLRRWDVYPLGFALFKALLLAKFVLVDDSVGRAMGPGADTGSGRGRLGWRIGRRAVRLLLVLIGLSVAEEVLAGLWHGRDPAEALHAMAGGTVAEAAATVLVLFLVLLPYVAFREIDAALGEGRLSRLLWGGRG